MTGTIRKLRVNRLPPFGLLAVIFGRHFPLAALMLPPGLLTTVVIIEVRNSVVRTAAQYGRWIRVGWPNSNPARAGSDYAMRIHSTEQSSISTESTTVRLRFWTGHAVNQRLPGIAPQCDSQKSRSQRRGVGNTKVSRRWVHLQRTPSKIVVTAVTHSSRNLHVACVCDFVASTTS
jgi:hypothetical protein